MPHLAALLLASPFSPPVFWPYLAGIAILALGIATGLRSKTSPPDGLDRILPFGPALYAAPIAVFGAEHLTAASEISKAVPHWFPAPLFWTWLVGIALLAAALSIATRRVTGLASTLLGLTLLSFVLLIHIPSQISSPPNRILVAVIFRDLGFSAGAFALASTLATNRWQPLARKVATSSRYVIGIGLLFFAVQHFLHPQFVPVVPLGLPMPAYIPFHPFWAFSVGAALFIAAFCLTANWHARSAATWLGLLVSAIVLLVYLPILISNPTDVGVAMNYFADTLMVAGNLLLLASSIPKPAVVPARPFTNPLRETPAASAPDFSEL